MAMVVLFQGEFKVNFLKEILDLLNEESFSGALTDTAGLSIRLEI